MVAQRQASFLITGNNADTTPILNGMPVVSDGIGGFMAASSLIALGRTRVAGVCVGGLPYPLIAGAIPGALAKIATGYVALPISQWALVTGDSWGLSPDTTYYLTPTPGRLTDVAPSNLSEEIGRASCRERV